MKKTKPIVLAISLAFFSFHLGYQSTANASEEPPIKPTIEQTDSPLKNTTLEAIDSPPSITPDAERQTTSSTKQGAPITVIYVDRQGKQIQPPETFYGKYNSYFLLPIPNISGYHFYNTPNNTIGIFSDKPQTYTLIYTNDKNIPLPPNYTYQKYNKYVTVTSKNYNTWRNFQWFKQIDAKTIYGKTYFSDAKYHHSNGSTYLSLYDNRGKWKGYINERATKVGKGQQGSYIKDGRTIRIKRKGYNTWNNFKWSRRNTASNLLNQRFIAKGRYVHYNGSTYYSLYNSKGAWYGYINANATK